jgi:hypothetical protein
MGRTWRFGCSERHLDCSVAKRATRGFDMAAEASRRVTQLHRKWNRARTRSHEEESFETAEARRFPGSSHLLGRPDLCVPRIGLSRNSFLRCILARGRYGGRGSRDLRRSPGRARVDRFPFDVWKISSRTLTRFDANGAHIARETNCGVSDVYAGSEVASRDGICSCSAVNASD